jgi:hypothetical protein
MSAFALAGGGLERHTPHEAPRAEQVTRPGAVVTGPVS